MPFTFFASCRVALFLFVPVDGAFCRCQRPAGRLGKRLGRLFRVL